MSKYAEKARAERVTMMKAIKSVLPGDFQITELLRRGLWERYPYLISTDISLPSDLQDDIQAAVDQVSPALPGIKLTFVAGDKT